MTTALHFQDKIVSAILVLLGAVAIGFLVTETPISGSQLLLVCLLVAITSVVLVPLVLDILRKSLDIFEARHIFGIMFLIYTVSPLLSILLYDVGVDLQPTPLIITYFNESIRPTVIFAAALAFTGIFAFQIGYRTKIPQRITTVMPLLPPIRRPGRLLGSAAIMAGVSLILLTLLMRSAGGVTSYFSAGYRSHLLVIGQTTLLIGYSWLATSLLLFFLWADLRESNWGRVVVVAGLAGYILLNAYVGRRRIPALLIMTLVVYLYYRGRLKGAKLLVALLGIVVYLSLGLSIRGYTPTYYTQGLLDALSNFSSDMLVRPFVGGEQAPFEAFLVIIDTVPEQAGPAWGQTYLNIVPSLIPRAIWPSRPDTTAHWYLNTFFPETRGTFSGYGFYFLAEAYLNFLFLGPPLVMFVMGMFYKWAYTLFRRTSRHLGMVMMYALFVAYTPSVLRSEMLFLKEFYVEFMGPLLVCLLFASCSQQRGLDKGSSRC